MSFPKSIFKAYDIRGLADSEITPDLAYRIGRSFAFFLKKDNNFSKKFLVVGADMRKSSPIYKKEVIRGINDEGINVLDIGLSTTPLFNFACAHYPQNLGGIMVTASHNGAVYNGFKLTLSSGLPIGKNNGMDKISKIAESNKFATIVKKGRVLKKQVLKDYLKLIFSLAPTKNIKPLKIILDAGNGMAKVTMPALLKKLPIKVKYLYLKPDGRFPNHEANPLKLETLRDLQKEVVKNRADFGFALDGDADRIGLVDEKGKIVEASFVGALLGLESLKKHPGGRMLYDLRSSAVVKDVWEKMGAKTEMCQVGHANIKKEMGVKKAFFASELSLHIYYGDLYNLESPELSLLYILSLLSGAKKTLSQIVAPLKKYFHSGEINFEIVDKEAVMKKIENKYKKDAQKISHLDGLWMSFDWGWFSVRASNTEPVLRLNLETKNKGLLTKWLKELKNNIVSLN